LRNTSRRQNEPALAATEGDQAGLAGREVTMTTDDHRGDSGEVETGVPGESALRRAERRVFEHPAAREYRELEALRRMLSAVFLPNLAELLALVDAAATNEKLGAELVQNVRRPDVRERFQDQTTQRLHNYVAGAMTIVDHVRRLMKGRTGPTAVEFAKRKDSVAQRPEIPFVQDLRNFTLHRTLPLFSYQFSVHDVNTSLQRTECVVGLTVSQLLEGDGWSSASKAFLRSQPETFELRPIVRSHGRLIAELNGWLHNELAKDNAAGIHDLNRLVEERNAVLIGGDVERARRFTTAWTAQRENAQSISREEFLQVLRDSDAPDAT